MLSCASRPGAASAATATAPTAASDPSPNVEPDRARRPSASVIVFVRHAEKGSGGDDPALTPEGHARARCLVHELDGFGPTALWSTQYVRTRQTLAPLQQQTGLPVVSLDSSAGGAWVNELTEVPAGSRVVVAGHSNTIPDWVRALGGDPGPVDAEGNIPHDEYDRIIFVVRDGGGRHVTTIVHRYC